MFCYNIPYLNIYCFRLMKKITKVKTEKLKLPMLKFKMCLLHWSLSLPRAIGSQEGLVLAPSLFHAIERADLRRKS